MSEKIVLIGRNQWVVDQARKALSSPGLQILGALNIQDVETIFDSNDIKHAFLGPGLDLETRVAIIRRIFELSDTTTVHLKDHSTGPEGALAFVRGILRGLKEI